MSPKRVVKKPLTADCPKGFTRDELVLLAKESGLQITRSSPLKGAKNMKELCDELHNRRNRMKKRSYEDYVKNVRNVRNVRNVKRTSNKPRDEQYEFVEEQDESINSSSLQKENIKDLFKDLTKEEKQEIKKWKKLRVYPSLSSSLSSSSSSSSSSSLSQSLDSESLESGEREYTKSTFTLTYGNRAENHRGMQIIGQKLDHGLSTKDLESAKKYFDKKGAKTIMIDLVDYLSEKDAKVVRESGVEAKILIVKKGVDYIVNVDKLYREVERTPKDTKAFMYGKVVNKHTRHNNVFSDFSQEPDYQEGKGTIINFKDVPLISKIRKEIPKMIPKNKGVIGLQCEGNYYYDVDKTFIGFHGDTEREIVIAVRLGADFNMYYQWYKDNKPIGKLFTYKLSNGDMYFMSEKAVGNDWKRRTQYTLRHAAAKNPKLVKLS